MATLKNLFVANLLIGVALTFSGPARAQTPTPPPAATASAPAAPVIHAHPALWVAHGKGSTIYLFGTIHILKPNVDWLDPTIKSAFDKSDTLMLEMVTPPQDEMMGMVMRLGVDTSGKTLTSKLNPTQLADYQGAMKTLGLPVAQFEPLKPWLAAVTITMRGAMASGYDITKGVEPVLTARAKDEKKTITGFETAEQQFGYFNALSTGDQAVFLDESAADIPKEAAEFDKMVTLWSEAKTVELADLLNADMKNPTIYKVLLTDRNQRFAEAIKARLASPGTVFVAVGAGHLAGPGSVQDDLAKLGVKVERVDH